MHFLKIIKNKRNRFAENLPPDKLFIRKKGSNIFIEDNDNFHLIMINYQNQYSNPRAPLHLSGNYVINPVTPKLFNFLYASL
jgi:hypothetical protein